MPRTRTTTSTGVNIATLAAREPEPARENGWVAVALDSRTGHYWHTRPESTVAALPQCSRCRLYMTDYSIVNDCAVGHGLRQQR